MFILKKGHQPGVYVPLRALFLVLQNRRADYHETWYVASATPAHQSMFK